MFILVLVSALCLMPAMAHAVEISDLATVIAALGGIDIAQYLAFVLFAVIGVVVHIIVDVYKGIIVPKPGDNLMNRVITYLFKTRLMATINMVIAVAVLGTTYFAVTPTPIGWTTLIIAALTAGYTSDSLFNRS